MTRSMIKCGGCDDTIDLDKDEAYWANISEEWLCPGCYESESSYASTVLMAGPDYQPGPEGPVKFYVADSFSMTQWGDEPTLDFKRTYTATDGWRGYNTTTIDGWTEVGLNGWTTGGWGDPIADRKQTFNEWVESLFEGEETFPPVNVAVAVDPTSNVFSSSITVYVEDGNVERFEEWVNGDLEELQESLA